MPTLSIFKTEFITVAKWAGIIFAGVLGIFILIKVVFFIKELVAPTPPPPPTVSFGKLPAIYFPDGIKKRFSYSIDTISGELPSFPDRTKVYKMTKSGPDILAVEKASEKIKTLGFEEKPEHLSDIVYRWRAVRSPSKNLVLNVKTGAFNLNSSFISDAGLSAKNIPDQKGAIVIAQNFLKSLSLYPEDIDEEKTKTELFTIKNGVLTKALSLSNTQLISVYFFEKDKDDMQIVYPAGTISSMNLVIGSGERNPQVVDARFSYQKISDKSGTYPIKTAGVAYEQLKKGEARIASHTGDELSIKIKKVYLGFYVEGREQKYLMPVIVFEGNNEYVAYVPAIKDEWISR